MTIRFDCPSCKAHYDVADDLGGKMIMCRVCQKRGPVKTSTTSSTATLPSVAKSAPPTPSRRNFLLIGGVLASLGAIATGAGLAQWRPWRHWGEDTSRNRGRGRGGPGGGPPGGDPPGGAPPGGAAPAGGQPSTPPSGGAPSK